MDMGFNEEERQSTPPLWGVSAGAEEKAHYAFAIFTHTATTAIDSEMRNHSIINLIP